MEWGRRYAESEDEVGEGGVVALDEDHVGGGAVEQGSEHLGWVGGAVVAEDSLVRYTSGNLHAVSLEIWRRIWLRLELLAET